MKFSLNLAQEFSNVELKSIPHDQIVTGMGLQLGAIEDTTEWALKYHGIAVVRVVTCVKHPNADNLSLCTIDDGGTVDNIERDDNGYVQVVCGAKNVREGLIAAWIPPGATVPSTTDKDPFVLEAREIRGKVSNGMLASPKELNISDEHEGIIEINVSDVGRDIIPGEPLVDFYGLDDFVVDCENKMFTHRPDCFGNLGIARELAGIFGLKFESPEWYLSDYDFSSNDAQSEEIRVENNITDLVPRFTAVTMSDVQVAKSPIWLQSQLKRVGIKSINNVVDVTNYIMHLTGQPLHAFDLDKLKLSAGNDNPVFGPRMAAENEEIKLLGDKIVKLSAEDMVISFDGKAVALAGVMGGAETEVDENTKNILIECANFDMYSVRRTSMRHGLFTDAVTRFNKGQSPLQNDKVIAYAMKLMSDLAGAQRLSPVYDLASFDTSSDNLSRVEVGSDFINSRLGSNLSADEMKSLLENVEFEVIVKDESLHITVPFWRMDIAIAEDIVEEVGRLYGYSKLPVNLPLRSSRPTRKNESVEFGKFLRGKLLQVGANEILSYSFVHGKLLEQVGIKPDDTSYHLRNAISPELQYYRPSLLPSLLSKVHGNIKMQAGSEDNSFAIYEIGKTHVKNDFEDDETNLPRQNHRLGFVFASDQKSAKTYSGSPYYQAKKYLDFITDGQAVYSELDDFSNPISAPLQKGCSALVTLGHGGVIIGVVGEISSSVKKALKLPDFVSGFEVDTELLRTNLQKPVYKPISKHPESEQDITLEVSESLNWGEINKFIHAELLVAHAELGYTVSLAPLSIFQEPKSDKKRISFRLTVNHNDKTLRSEEVNTLLDSICKAVNEKFEAVRI